MVRHRNILANIAEIAQAFSLGASDESVCWLPSAHDMGLIDGIIQPVVTGSSATLISPLAFLQRPQRWLQAISRFRGTHSGGPNFAYELCVAKIGPEMREGLDLSSWVSAYNGAEPVRARTLDRFARAFEPCGFERTASFPCYGLAEDTLMVTGGPVHLEPPRFHASAEALERGEVVAADGEVGARSLVACGQTWRETEIAIVDPEVGQRCAPDRVGEIWVTGPSVAAGYWEKPEETEGVFGARLPEDPRRYLRTGDLGFLSEGQLYVTGRLKDLILIRGRNLYPQDIELTVERVDARLRRGCVIAFSIEERGEERLGIAAEVKPADDPSVYPALADSIAAQG